MTNHWASYGMDWWMWVLMILGILGFWVLVAAVVRSVIQAEPSAPASSRTSEADPLRVLDERLARGEIDTQEYQHTRNVLTGFR
ncbi:SHOCT domain-containing protein [Intrasporangium calvum]|uniref:SHOCT domain-containing protein n=1 Tax=Intrasporangium calvum TaxID=53358 RepID=UPI000DF5F7DB|nr:SHOCT domain-containing protein [Intrasporangium calvum]AXG14416.1 SHOCT domain-containing protein [Intrasporangium calvum]